MEPSSIAVLVAMALAGPGGPDLGATRPTAPMNLHLSARAERSSDQIDWWPKYVLVGGALGGAAGGVTGFFTQRGGRCNSSTGCADGDRRTAEGVLIGAGVGAIAGLLIGLRD